MAEFFHPQRDDLSLTAILAALGDPLRLSIVRTLASEAQGLNCTSAVETLGDVPKSTLSHHFRILREAGLIHTQKRGVENLNRVRLEDVEARFPGMLGAVLQHTKV